MRKLLCSLVLITAASPALGQEALEVVAIDSVAWKSHPLFPGSQTALLVGDPAKSGAIVQRNKLPPNFKLAPHQHSFLEVGTVISGSLWQAEGDQFDAAKGRMLQAGSVWVLPPGRPHYLWTTSEEAVFQINFVGPARVDFANPTDDPRNRK
jgi:quercetin dioxygenase-like cupin family protein